VSNRSKKNLIPPHCWPGRAPSKPDHWHCRLLRPCRKRPCRRAADERDELAPSHVLPQAEDHIPCHIVEKAGLCITAFWPTRLPRWVKIRLLPGYRHVSSRQLRTLPWRRPAAAMCQSTKSLRDSGGCGLAPVHINQEGDRG
jgi:hypothetical protein